MTNFPPPESNVPSGPPAEPVSNGEQPVPPAAPPVASPAPPAPAEALPAYGERIPGYVLPPAYGQQPPLYQQPPAYQQPPVYGQPAPGYTQPLYGEQVSVPKSRTLGLVAMIIAIVVFVVTLAVFIDLGTLIGPYAVRSGNSVTINQQTATPAISGFSLGLIATLFFGTAFGLWALVQGIVATAKNRGRAFGIIAIVVAVLAPLVSFMAFGFTITAMMGA